LTVNPTGAAQRINYEKKIPFYWRYTRKIAPFALLMGGLVYWDTKRGIF
jgi:hypothetical protein